jgi:hypothetical protein
VRRAESRWSYYGKRGVVFIVFLKQTTTQHRRSKGQRESCVVTCVLMFLAKSSRKRQLHIFVLPSRLSPIGWRETGNCSPPIILSKKKWLIRTEVCTQSPFRSRFTTNKVNPMYPCDLVASSPAVPLKAGIKKKRVSQHHLR